MGYYHNGENIMKHHYDYLIDQLDAVIASKQQVEALRSSSKALQKFLHLIYGNHTFAPELSEDLEVTPISYKAYGPMDAARQSR